MIIERILVFKDGKELNCYIFERKRNVYVIHNNKHILYNGNYTGAKDEWDNIKETMTIYQTFGYVIKLKKD